MLGTYQSDGPIARCVCRNFYCSCLRALGGIHSKGTGNLRAGVVYLYDWHSGRSGFFPFVPKQGKTLILITLLIVASACLTGVGMKYLFDIDTPSIVGLIAGALTSTPGLAVAIDSTSRRWLPLPTVLPIRLG